MKSIPTPLAKSVLVPLGLTAVTSRCSYPKEHFCVCNDNINNFQ